jgi:arylsulfatase A-like enzyme
MRRRSPSLFVPLLLCWISAGAAGPGCGGDEATGPTAERVRPNVVVIVIDTLRADRLPFYGHDRDTAPFLASLAEHSLVFDAAWATSSWTAPATASIFTGLHPNEHGVRLGLRADQKRAERERTHTLNRIPDEVETLPAFMRSLGYRTFGASANPNVDARLGFERGFDRFSPFDPSVGKTAEGITRAVLEWREEMSASQPFFLYLHFADPHGPYRRHEEWMPADAPRPKNPLDDIAAYESEIRHTDEHVRLLFDALGLGRDTLVVMTSDHGQEFLDHGHRGHGWQLYSELTRVPLFVHYPADDRLRGRSSANVSNLDILATLAELLAPEAAARPPGRSLLVPGVNTGSGERAAFSMRTRHAGETTNRLFSVVMGPYKLIVHEPDGRRELYDLRSDPAEQQDLAGQRPELEAQMLALIEAQRETARSVGSNSEATITIDRALEQALEALGYVEGGENAGEGNDPAAEANARP